jgi:hypothetical protein
MIIQDTVKAVTHVVWEVAIIPAYHEFLFNIDELNYYQFVVRKKRR